MEREQLIQAALGETAPELVLKNARVINVFTGEILPADVAVSHGKIIGVGSYNGVKEIDLQGKFVAPGFVNAHCHVESAMVTPPAYCMEELRWGVTTLITDPHEITNVLGAAGVQYMLDASEGLPVNYYVQVPSCVPATPFEHAGDVFTAEKMAAFRNHPRVTGLGEMMNYPGVASCAPDVMDKLALFDGTVLDGHAPSITGAALQAYVAAGITTDHESISYDEAREKLRAGMAVLVREGSASKNLRDIMQGVIADGLCTDNLAFCTDDKHLSDIRREGTIRWNIKCAVDLGLSAVRAIQMATINAARIYRLRGIGAVAPGYRADLVVLEDLKDFMVHSVYKDGRCLFGGDAVSIGLIGASAAKDAASNTVRIAPLAADAFALQTRETYPVIEILPGQIATRMQTLTHDQVQAGLADGTLRKIAVIERHNATGNIGVGLISGYGLTHGAVATTVAHDSHNLIVVGENDADMHTAVQEIVRIQGGYAIVQGGQVKGTLPLPVAGLMSDAGADELIAQLDHMLELARAAGVRPGIDPFITLSFMALPVIPEVRITDMGMFDVNQFAFIP